MYNLSEIFSACNAITVRFEVESPVGTNSKIWWIDTCGATILIGIMHVSGSQSMHAFLAR